jgi:hypothetical protein
VKITRMFEGFCPTLNKNYSVEVEYIDARSFDHPNKFIQGLGTCEHHGLFRCPIVSECPIRAKAPKEINY